MDSVVRGLLARAREQPSLGRGFVRTGARAMILDSARGGGARRRRIVLHDIPRD